MATRRIKMFTNNHYVQPLKICFKHKMLITLGACYNNIVTNLKHKACQDSDFKVNAWMRFNTDTFDGSFQVQAFLSKNNLIKSIGSCTFSIYEINPSNLWQETLKTTIAGTPLVNGSFSGIVPESVLLPTIADGEMTYKLQVDITRQDKTFTDVYYFNHLGIYDSVVRLRKKVNFLALTKLDE